MTGETTYPTTADTVYGAYDDYFAGDFDDILGDGTGIDFAAWMTRQDTGIAAMQTYGARVLGKRTGATITNSNTATSVLASTISIPANLLQAGSILEFRSRGVVTINSGTPTLTFTALLGGTSYDLGTSATITTSANPRQYDIRMLFTANTVGATADVHVSGNWRYSAATTNGFDLNSASLVGGNTGTVNTTSAMTFDLKATMSVANAANTVISGLTTIAHTPYIG